MKLEIRKRREDMGMTQSELAKKIGKSFRTVQSWERDESYPNAEMVWALCEVFGCTPNDLLGWYEEHPREDAPQLARDEAALLADYRSCTPEWKRNVAMTAVSAKGESLKSAEHPARVDGLAS